MLLEPLDELLLELLDDIPAEDCGRTYSELERD
jgi:hypothetical protein